MIRHSVSTALLGVALGAAVATAAHAQSLPLAESRRTLAVQGERYGMLGDDHPVTVNVRAIFEKIVRAAGRRPGIVMEVHVLDTDRVIAEALAGGLVVISRGAVTLAQSDDAIAFVLGHEVAHLARDHHGMLNSLGGLGAGPTVAPALPSAERAAAARTTELEADRLGTLFAALAGYRPAVAMPVLVQLAARMGRDTMHPDAGARVGAVGEQLALVARDLEIFHLGLFLVAGGRYLDGARMLEHFLTLFPSREVLSAIGVAYHKEALRYVPEPEFHHLLVIDATTRAPATKGANAHPAFRRLMEQAVRYYTLAVDADPAYAPARTNLAAANLDLGERELALGHLARAMKDDPRFAAAYNNRGVAHAAGGEYRRAEEDWLHAAQLDPELRQPPRNLARLYEVLGRREDAQRWSSRISPAVATSGASSADIFDGIAPGMPVSRVGWIGEPGVRQLDLVLDPTSTSSVKLVVSASRGLTVLSRGNTVEAVGAFAPAVTSTRQGVRPGDTVARVKEAYGPPASLDGIQALRLWGYPARGLAVFEVGGRVRAIWAGLQARRAP
jgi:tetratricopeptide (TPR) repeat protein